MGVEGRGKMFMRGKGAVESRRLGCKVRGEMV